MKIFRIGNDYSRMEYKTLLVILPLMLVLTGARCDKEENTDLQDDEMKMDDLGETESDPFTLVTRITPSGIQEGDFFGYAIASTTNFTAASAPFDNEKGARTGVVYVFKRDGLEFETTAHIIYPESATTEDYFGWSLAMDDEILVVGAPRNDKNGEDAGMAYVYQHSADNQWSLIKELEAPNASASQEFGNVVAIENGLVVVASKFDSDNYYDEGDITNARGIAQGSVYIFEEASNWEFSQKLLPTNETGHKWDAFGKSLGISANTIAVGAPGTDNTTYRAPGSVYTFEKVGSLWEEKARIEALDGEVEDFFGSDLSLVGSTLAVTSPGSYNSLMPNDNQPLGAAYVFSQVSNEWSEESKLVPDDVVPDDHFGSGGLGLHDDFLVVGAPFSEEVTKSNGSVYFFSRGQGWTESHKIIAPDPLNEDLFGGSLAIGNDLIFVGAHRRCNETGCWAGALYFVQ